MSEGTAFCPGCGSPQTPAASPVQPAAWPQPAAPGARPPSVFDAGYATWGNRVVGFLIDGLLVGGAMLVLSLVLGTFLGGLASLGGRHGADSAIHGTCCMLLVLLPVATLLVGLYNSVYLISQRGFSIGQGVVKVKVVDAYGNLLTQGTAFVRLLARVGLGFVPFGSMLDLLWPLWDERQQTLHDKAVGCYVVNNPSGV